MRQLANFSYVILFSAILANGASTPTLAQDSQNNGQGSRQIPENVIYEFYFRRMAYLEDLAQKKEKEGLSGSSFRDTITNELEISEIQRVILTQIGIQSLAEAAALDSQAAAIIEREHSRYPEGIIPGMDRAPQPPPELAELQKSRDKIFLRAKVKLSQQIGGAAFPAIDSRIKEIILPNVIMKSPQ